MSHHPTRGGCSRRRRAALGVGILLLALPPLAAGAEAQVDTAVLAVDAGSPPSVGVPDAVSATANEPQSAWAVEAATSLQQGEIVDAPPPVVAAWAEGVTVLPADAATPTDPSPFVSSDVAALPGSRPPATPRARSTRRTPNPGPRRATLAPPDLPPRGTPNPHRAHPVSTTAQASSLSARGAADLTPPLVAPNAGSTLIPDPMRSLYRRAGERFGIDWTILAAIGSVESDHGRSNLPGVTAGLNRFGCCAGPMQFNLTDGPPSTWDSHGRDENGDGVASPWDPEDAVPAAARKLVADGAPADWTGALLAYNNDAAYVRDVLARAATYRRDMDWVPPVDGSPAIIGLPGQGSHTLGNWQSDNAIDLAVPVGTHVRAVCDATIGPNLGWSSGGIDTASRYAGLRLTLDCGADRVWYAHLASYASGVSAGATVRRGDVLGTSGAANGVAHLHIALEIGDPRTLAG